MLDSIHTWIKNKDFTSLYQSIHTTDTKTEALSDEDKEELLPYILELATEVVHEQIISGRKLDFEQESEHFMLRFLYDDAMSAYEAGEIYETKEALALLSALTSSKHFEKSLHKHILALVTEVGFTDFVQHWMTNQPLKHFYISEFSDEIEKRFKNQQSLVEEATQSYKKLFK